MTRRDCVWQALALSACRGAPPLAPDLFPDMAAGGWRRVWTGDVPDVRDPVPRDAVEQSRAAAYEGPGKLEARVYRLSSAAVGLDLAQRWRPSADTVFFNQGPYFVVVKWQAADRKALQDFVREMEGKLAPKGR